jgi:hypothetical protein
MGPSPVRRCKPPFSGTVTFGRRGYATTTAIQRRCLTRVEVRETIEPAVFEARSKYSAVEE